MTKHKTDYRTLRSRRDTAMDRPELRGDSVAREAAAGPVSFPVKAEDPAIRKMIDEALAKRQ